MRSWFNITYDFTHTHVIQHYMRPRCWGEDLTHMYALEFWFDYHIRPRCWGEDLTHIHALEFWFDSSGIREIQGQISMGVSRWIGWIVKIAAGEEHSRQYHSSPAKDPHPWYVRYPLLCVRHTFVCQNLHRWGPALGEGGGSVTNVP